MKDLLDFIAANPIPPDTEVQVVRDASGHSATRIDVEAISVTGLGVTADGWLRIDTY